MWFAKTPQSRRTRNAAVTSAYFIWKAPPLADSGFGRQTTNCRLVIQRGKIEEAMLRPYSKYSGKLERLVDPLMYIWQCGTMFRSNIDARNCSKLLDRVSFALSPISRQFGDNEKPGKLKVVV